MSKSIRCLQLNVRSALDILLQHNTVDQEERLKRNTTQFFLPIIKKCLNVQVQDRLVVTVRTSNKMIKTRINLSQTKASNRLFHEDIV